MALTTKRKEEKIKEIGTCYVCQQLGYRHASLSGYELKHIQFDHWKAKSLVGDSQENMDANQLPIHAYPGGDDFRSPNYEHSTRRNCHKGKGNAYSGEEWVERIRIYRKVQELKFSDDLFPGRVFGNAAYDVKIDWQDDKAVYDGTDYPVMVQQFEKDTWKSFSMIVKPELLWKDPEVQTREANREKVMDMAWHLRKLPLLSPILCRYADNRLFVFDGNHRLSAFVLARNNQAVPVTIFEGPNSKVFLDVVALAHDKFTQTRYQYTEKALKYSGIAEDELEAVRHKYGKDASEELAWKGLRNQEAQDRIYGNIVTRLTEAKDYRTRWKEKGLVDNSWVFFIHLYTNMRPVRDPFDSEAYLREEEIANLIALCDAFDEEIFEVVPEHVVSKSLKTKYWKQANKIFAAGLKNQITAALALPRTPEAAAYCKRWDDNVKVIVRKALGKWRDNPIWRGDARQNNEADIDRELDQNDFTDILLFKKD